MIYNIELTDEQNAILDKIANSINKTNQEVIDEQVNFYIKKMILDSYPEFRTDIDGLSDNKAAKLLALLAITKDNFFNK